MPSRPSSSSRTLADLGEAKLIERIARRAGQPRGSEWPVTIGDDAALLRPRKGQDVVLSVDATVEDVHFRWGRESPSVVGRRALAVNLSDLAAMGAKPTGALLSLSAPPNLSLSHFDGMIRGLLKEAGTFGCPLVGGNLSRSAKTSLHVTVIGQVSRGAALRRGQIRAGDELFVTGTLGAAALARLRADAKGGRLTRVPTPRVEAGLRLARDAAVTGCIDVSDGLATDLPNLLRGSGLGAEVDWDALPAPRGFERGCQALGCDPLELQLRGGEDYELLFAYRTRREGQGARRTSAAEALTRSLGVAVSRVGVVRRRLGLPGLPVPATAHHF